MPFEVVKRTGEKPFKVVNSDTGRVLGSFKTREQALAQMRALYANGAAEDA